MYKNSVFSALSPLLCFSALIRSLCYLRSRYLCTLLSALNCSTILMTDATQNPRLERGQVPRPWSRSARDLSGIRRGFDENRTSIAGGAGPGSHQSHGHRRKRDCRGPWTDAEG